MKITNMTLCLFLLFSLNSCTSERPLTKQQQLNRSIKAIETAFEARELSDITAYISHDYSDDSGRKFVDIKRAIHLQLMRHQSLYVFSSVKEIIWENDDKANVNIVAAMAGKPIESASILTSLRADMINFQVTFIRADEKFHVQSAQWKWAEPSDFL